MSAQVKPLHHVTVEFSLSPLKEPAATGIREGRHRFLYGVQTWIPAIDHRLDGLFEGDIVEFSLEPAALRASGVAVEPECAHPARLVVRIVEVQKAEPREVVKALAATVHCCDHCEGH